MILLEPLIYMQIKFKHVQIIEKTSSYHKICLITSLLSDQFVIFQLIKIYIQVNFCTFHLSAVKVPRDWSYSTLCASHSCPIHNIERAKRNFLSGCSSSDGQHWNIHFCCRMFGIQACAWTSATDFSASCGVWWWRRAQTQSGSLNGDHMTMWRQSGYQGPQSSASCQPGLLHLNFIMCSLYKLKTQSVEVMPPHVGQCQSLNRGTDFLFDMGDFH